MGAYNDRPWVNKYDEGVRPDFVVEPIDIIELHQGVINDFPDRVAFYFSRRAITFRELDSLVCRFTNFLRSLGLGKGDVVGINLPNLPQYMVGQLGATQACCATTGVSPLLSPKEMAYQLNDCGARLLLTMDLFFEEKFLKIRDQVPGLEHIVVTNVADFLPGWMRLLGKLTGKMPTGKVVPVKGKQIHRLMEILDKFPEEKPPIDIDPDDNCLVQYTGGTTGFPKGTELTFRSLAANLQQFNEWFGFERGAEVFLSGFPYFHLAGLGVGLGALSMGYTQVMIPDPRNTWHICREIKRRKPTVMINVPTLYQMLFNVPKFRQLDFSGLKFCFSAAAPLSAEAFREMEAVIGKGKILEAYGMTEASPLITMNPYKGEKRIGSVGVPISNTMVKLVDPETGTKEVPAGQEGELIARGPQIMKGYLNKPEETAKTLRKFEGETWLYTGDIAKMDEDGYFYLVDRAKDMLIVGGYKVFSREVEEAFHELPEIELCALIGLPNPQRPDSQIVKLFVELSPKHKNDDREKLREKILDFAREDLAPYKVPKFVEFIDAIPLTPIGKVDKKALRLREAKITPTKVHE